MNGTATAQGDEEIAPILTETLEALEEQTKLATGWREECARKEREIVRLQAEVKAAEQKSNDVTLHKVAFDTSRVDQVVDVLVSKGWLRSELRVGIADNLRKNAGFSLDMIEKMASTDPEAPRMGSGVEEGGIPYQRDKEGSESSRDPDGWTALIEKGRAYQG